MAHEDQKWYVLFNSKVWLSGIVYQGNRLLTNQRRWQTAMQAIDRGNIMRNRQILELYDIRLIEEHFFVSSVSKTIDWLKEVPTFRPNLATDIDLFLRNFPEAKDLRNMREHDTARLPAATKKAGGLSCEKMKANVTPQRAPMRSSEARMPTIFSRTGHDGNLSEYTPRRHCWNAFDV